MDYHPLIIAMRPRCPRLVRWIADRFERFNGKKVQIVNGADLEAVGAKGVNCFDARMWVWQIVPPTVERVLYMDFDMVPVKPLPPLPEDADFAATPVHLGRLDFAVHQYTYLQRSKYALSTSFFLARRSSKPAFDIARLYSRPHGTSPMCDYALNIALQGSGLKLVELPATLNWSAWRSGDPLGEDIVMAHYQTPDDEWKHSHRKWRMIYALRCMLDGPDPQAIAEVDPRGEITE